MKLFILIDIRILLQNFVSLPMNVPCYRSRLPQLQILVVFFSLRFIVKDFKLMYLFLICYILWIYLWWWLFRVCCKFGSIMNAPFYGSRKSLTKNPSGVLISVIFAWVILNVLDSFLVLICIILWFMPYCSYYAWFRLVWVLIADLCWMSQVLGEKM